MKNHSHRVVSGIFCLFFLFVTGTIAQETSGLPKEKKLASNGTFVAANENQPGEYFSLNGSYRATFTISAVSDENREITDFRLFDNGRLIYHKPGVPGSDVMVSNSGLVVVFDMGQHFKQQTTLNFLNRNGALISSRTHRYASVFGFSPSGNKFVAGTDQNLLVFDLERGLEWTLNPCSEFGFSEDEEYLATAREDKLWIYHNYALEKEIQTGLFYPRAIAVDPGCKLVTVVGKVKLIAFHLSDHSHAFEADAPANASFRDVLIHHGRIYAGVHERLKGISRGILQVYAPGGHLLRQEVIAEKTFKTFTKQVRPEKSGNAYDPIPWPFEPFDQVHKVWNHYEQHMGDGSGSWAYLHQGLDIETPIDEPTYAVEEGWVKLVLTLGGDIYWRVAVSPVQSSGYSTGWLYAHLVPESIQVDVGDYVELHDYLGDIIYWSADWGHIHFVNIRDQGDIWYYNDDEWGINFNPLLALVPNTDEYVPVIENFSPSSKFGYCVNETSNYLNPANLSGALDIIAKISDYHGSSEWEQPAYLTYYWVKKHPEGNVVFPKTLGQILNHSYAMYSSGYYENYAPLLYKKDNLHPSPPWMNFDRDYYQILTNNNGDSVAEPWETELAFNTADYYDGTYMVFVEAWDEYGNMAVDSQLVVFVNNNISGLDHQDQAVSVWVYPNPADNQLIIRLGSLNTFDKAVLFDQRMAQISNLDLAHAASNGGIFRMGLNHLKSGVYFILFKSDSHQHVEKFIKQ